MITNFSSYNTKILLYYGITNLFSRSYYLSAYSLFLYAFHLYCLPGRKTKRKGKIEEQ